jgi:hypothetical protein
MWCWSEFTVRSGPADEAGFERIPAPSRKRNAPSNNGGDLRKGPKYLNCKADREPSGPFFDYRVRKARVPSLLGEEDTSWKNKELQVYKFSDPADREELEKWFLTLVKTMVRARRERMSSSPSTESGSASKTDGLDLAPFKLSGFA